MTPHGNTPGDVLGGIRATAREQTRWRSAAHSPLGFFVLALFIVEAFIVGAGIWFGLSEIVKIIVLGIGVLLFLIVFGTVVWLVIKFPKNLVFGEDSHIRVHEMEVWGSKDRPVLPGVHFPKTSGQAGTAIGVIEGHAVEFDRADEEAR